MNWGKGLTIALIGFITYILSMVFVMINQPNDKVEEDYYQQEINYESRKIATENAFKYKQDIALNITENYVEIIFPKEINVAKINTGILYFYRPENAKLDKKIAVKNNEGNTQKVLRSALTKGNYILKLSWEENNKNYYLEKEITI